MNKTLALASLLLVAAFSSHAGDRFSMGLKVGGNIANLSEIPHAKSRFGMNAGVFTECLLSERWAISPELLYSRTGARFADKKRLDLDYLALPVLARLRLAGGHVNFDAGIQAGWLLGARYRDTSDNSKTWKVRNAEDMEFSLPVGVTLSDGSMMLQVRYFFALTPVIDSPEYKSYNELLQISVGVRF